MDTQTLPFVWLGGQQPLRHRRPRLDATRAKYTESDAGREEMKTREGGGNSTQLYDQSKQRAMQRQMQVLSVVEGGTSTEIHEMITGF